MWYGPGAGRVVEKEGWGKVGVGKKEGREGRMGVGGGGGTRFGEREGRRLKITCKADGVTDETRYRAGASSNLGTNYDPLSTLLTSASGLR